MKSKSVSIKFIFLFPMNFLGGTDERPAHDSKYSGNNSGSSKQSYLGLLLLPAVLLAIINRISKC
jgi:hypothetical protein